MTPQTTIRGPWPRKGIVIEVRPAQHIYNKGQSKYADLFAALAEGDSIKCRAQQRRALSNALNGWLRSNAKAQLFRAAYSVDDDGNGLVTLVSRETK